MAISGYADFVSVRPGGTLNLHVSTDAPRFRAELYRVGAARGPARSVWHRAQRSPGAW